MESDTSQHPTPEVKMLPAEAAGEADADFDGEELGERQPDACSLDEGCERCQ